MIDFHTHCLPGMDDGAVDEAASLTMLQDSVAQGITAVAATSHFIPGEESVSLYLERRAAALERVLAVRDADPTLAGSIHIIPGAEVLIREGVSQLDLRPLCLQGSDVILLELPFAAPPVWLYEEIEEIVFGQKLRVMLAHVDRYMTWYSGERLGYMMDTPGLIIQLNGENIRSRHAFRLLRRWLPQTDHMVLGSDMHGSDGRVQDRQAVCRRLSRNRIGKQWLQAIDACSAELARDCAAGML